MTVEFPEKLKFLFDPYRYKILKGGRGGMKTYSVADALLIEGARQYERVLCAREEMDSIRESVHEILEQRVYALGLQCKYQILQSAIYGPEYHEGRTEFFFAGLRHNVRKIKSTEGVTKMWVEEAQSVSKHSWDTIIPTIRWDNKKPVDSPERRDSEIWLTFNSELETDDTYQRFVLNKPPNSILCHTDYRDNPWFPEVLRIEMEYMRDHEPAMYRHVWLGECLSSLQGAIYGAEMKLAEAEGRLTKVSLDRTRPVDTFWDLGYGDKTAIWFAQAVDGWYNVIDYLEDSGEDIAYYCVQLQNRGYVYGTDWLPHDAVDTIIHAKLAGGDKSRSIEMLMRAAGRKVRVAPKLHVADRINAGRIVFPQCRFDRDKCLEGLTALSHYQWGPPPRPHDPNFRDPRQTVKPGSEHKRDPLHNWASHGADAFQTMAVSIKQPKREAPKERRPPVALSPWS